MAENEIYSRRPFVIWIVALALALTASIGYGVYATFFDRDSYLQDINEIYIMESGILLNNLEFADGEQHTFAYDFSDEAYARLISEYRIDEIAGEGTQTERALRLMHEFAPRLTHKGDFANDVEMNALSLLEYSLDDRSQGINCRNKAQILNEMNLALGIYSRKVWIMPYSGYDRECHVVNEIWDSALEKWVMLDITNDQYWVDENGTPLSVLEIRHKGAMHEFCTPVRPGDSLDDLARLREKYIGSFVYIMKNMTYMEYTAKYGVGEDDVFYLLFPENLDTDYELLISRDSCECPPEQ